jgi:hypothetical protein
MFKHPLLIATFYFFFTLLAIPPFLQNLRERRFIFAGMFGVILVSLILAFWFAINSSPDAA